MRERKIHFKARYFYQGICGQDTSNATRKAEKVTCVKCKGIILMAAWRIAEVQNKKKIGPKKHRRRRSHRGRAKAE